MSVYLICHKGSEVGKDVYVGSTSNTLARKLSAHRSRAFGPGNGKNKLHQRMRGVGPKNWVIRPLESAVCSEYEIRKLELAWCEILRSDLNSVSPIRLGEKKKIGTTAQTVYLLHNKNSKTGKDSYVGSTAQSLARRLTAHRSAASRPGTENNRLYRRMREVELKNWVIRLLDTTTCSNDDLRKLERKWCEKLCSDLNTRLPFQTDEEKREYNEKYREKNREVLLRKKSEYNEKYREKNREVILKKQAAYRESNRKMIPQEATEYRKKNREAIREKAASYREKNRARKKFFCEVCNITFGSGKNLERHNETLKHQ